MPKSAFTTVSERSKVPALGLSALVMTAWNDTAAHGRGFAAMLDAGSCLVALPSTSELIAFQPVGSQYEELAVIKVSEKPTYAHPVIAGNRIFVKDQDAVTMWAVE